MERDTTFKDHHIWELQRRDALNSSLSLPVGVFTVVAGGALAMARSIDIEDPFANPGLSAALLATAFFVLCNLFCLGMSLIRYKYSHAPDMGQWLKDREHFESEYRKKWRGLGLTKGKVEHEARREFYNHLDRTYATSASNNANQNNRKAKWIADSHRCLLASIGFLILAGVLLSISPKTPTDDAASESQKDEKTMIAPSKPEKPTNNPASLPSSTPKGIERLPVRDPVVVNEKFPQKDVNSGLDDL